MSNKAQKISFKQVLISFQVLGWALPLPVAILPSILPLISTYFEFFEVRVVVTSNSHYHVENGCVWPHPLPGDGPHVQVY